VVSLVEAQKKVLQYSWELAHSVAYWAIPHWFDWFQQYWSSRSLYYIKKIIVVMVSTIGLHYVMNMISQHIDEVIVNFSPEDMDYRLLIIKTNIN